MVGVESDIIKVIVFATGTDALLRICGTPWIVGAVDLTEEDGHELVHASIGEEQVGTVRHETAGRDDGVLFRFKKIEEALTNLSASHGGTGKTERPG